MRNFRIDLESNKKNQMEIPELNRTIPEVRKYQWRGSAADWSQQKKGSANLSTG